MKNHQNQNQTAKNDTDKSKLNNKNNWEGEWGNAIKDNKKELETLLLKKKI